MFLRFYDTFKLSLFLVEHKSTLHEVLIKLCEGFFVYPSMNVAEITEKYIRYSVQAEFYEIMLHHPVPFRLKSG